MTAKTKTSRLRACCAQPARLLSTYLLIACFGASLIGDQVAGAVTMRNDPKGFHDIAWGAPLSETQFALSHLGSRISDYRLKSGTPRFGDTDVDSIMFSTVEDQFARVTIRYRGEATHKALLAYLERTYGQIERIPGQMTRGLNQQYNWRGPETEINLTYEGSLERGYIFIESRTLSPRFNDGLTDSGD